MDNEELEPLRAKYAVKKELAPFMLTFDLGLPVFGEEFTFKTPKHLSYGSDVVPRIAQEEEENERMFAKFHMGKGVNMVDLERVDDPDAV